jgi:hypothetical protein
MNGPILSGDVADPTMLPRAAASGTPGDFGYGK